jgi:hypothetical protein
VFFTDNCSGSRIASFIDSCVGSGIVSMKDLCETVSSRETTAESIVVANQCQKEAPPPILPALLHSSASFVVSVGGGG